MRFHQASTIAAILVALPLSISSARLDDESKNGVDSDGFISKWLVLAPIARESEQEGAAALAKEQVKDEASIKPKAGDSIDVGGKELTWKEATAKEGAIDFNAILGQETENSVAYAVSYLDVADDQDGVTLKVGSDDQVRIYLNGKRVHSFDEDRSFEKDQDSVEGISLKKGRNVLVMKVVNGVADWSASVRFLDKDGKPVSGITATTKPE